MENFNDNDIKHYRKNEIIRSVVYENPERKE